jgi:Flp pilus assembly protein TadD
MYYQKGLLKEASDEFNRVLTLNKNYVRAHNNLGIIYAENGQLSEAIAEFEKILTYNPHNEKAKNNLAIMKERLASESAASKNLP